MSSFLSFLFPAKSSKNLPSPKATMQKHRRLHHESLEERALLAVTPADFAAIKAAYPDLGLQEMSKYNILEITAEELSEASLRAKIAEAGDTAADDLIVVRTTATQNKITLGGTELVINIDAETKGSITIVSLGDEKLTIDANHRSRVFNIGISTLEKATVMGIGGLVVTGGNAEVGGGIYCIKSNTYLRNNTVTLDHCSIVQNSAIRSAGGVSSSGIMNFYHCDIAENAVTGDRAGNSGSYGGGIYNSGTMSLNDSSVVNNTVTATSGIGYSSGAHGGGIFSVDNLTLIRSRVHANKAESLTERGGAGGGGISTAAASSILTMIDSEISENQVIANNKDYYANGGGISYCGVATLTNCKITGNSVTLNVPGGTGWVTGGGIDCADSDRLEMTNCEVSGNSLLGHDARGAGVGVYIKSADKIFLSNCTIVDNTAISTDETGSTQGGGIYIRSYLDRYQCTIRNSIIANNEADLGADVHGLGKGLNNLIVDPIGCTWVDDDNNLYGVDPAFVDSARGNYHLAEGSPAIDAGSNSHVTTTVDLDGNPRIQGGTVDIGAYESPEVFSHDMPGNASSNHWVIRRQGDRLAVVDGDDQVIETYSLDLRHPLVINTSGATDDSLTIDFSYGGVFSLDQGILFNGHAETVDTLYFLGTDGDDTVVFRAGETVFNDLAIYTRNVTRLSLDAKGGNDSATVFGTDTNNMFSISDNFFAMTGGGYRLELGNFSSVEAFAAGRNDTTYVYGENASLIVMNDRAVERRAQDQFYRVWHSENVTAINTGDANNVLLHTGSRAYDDYTMAEGYGIATNAVGSYRHEFVGFRNIIISNPMIPPVVSLPTATGWTQGDNRNVWSQNGFDVTILGQSDVVTRDGSALPLKAEPFVATLAAHPSAQSLETASILSPDTPVPSLADPHASTPKPANQGCNEVWEDNFLVFLAAEQLRLQRHQNSDFAQNAELGDWLDRFEKLAIMELMK